MYSIAIENDFCDDWVTEKFFDCLYSETFAFYYGCPNLEKYVDSRTFHRIDINDFEGSVATIERIVNDSTHNNRIKTALKEAKLKSLNQDNFFPWIVSFLYTMDSKLEKESIKIQSTSEMKSFKMIRYILNKTKTPSLLKNFLWNISTK